MLPWGSVLQISLSTMIQSISLHAVLRNGHEQLNQMLAQILACDIYVIPVISDLPTSSSVSRQIFPIPKKNVLNIMPKSKQWLLGWNWQDFLKITPETMNTQREDAACAIVTQEWHIWKTKTNSYVRREKLQEKREEVWGWKERGIKPCKLG